MHRRSFVRLLAAAPLAGTFQTPPGTPARRVVSTYAAAAAPGMPGPYPGRVVSVHSDKCVDIVTNRANDDVVREMMARGMRTLTGASTAADAWRRFFEPSDVVGIKVNCGGYPFCVSADEIVAEAVRQLTGIGVPVSQIYVYERFQNQLDEVNYAPHLPQGVQIVAAERANLNADNSGYDPATYMETDLFGEEDTRSNLMRLVSRRLTKIINIPNMKDHGATGVTGCLKNIAYGSFSNVARTHQRRQVAHLLARRRAGSGRAPALEDGAADHGRAARRVARRSVRENDALRVLSRARSCSAPIRSPSIACCSTSSRSSVARRARSRSGTARPALCRSTTPERAMPIPTSTSSSASRATWSTRRASASGCTIGDGSRWRTSRYDRAPAARRLPAMRATGCRASRPARRSRRPRSNDSAWRPSAPMPGGPPGSR